MASRPLPFATPRSGGPAVEHNGHRCLPHARNEPISDKSDIGQPTKTNRMTFPYAFPYLDHPKPLAFAHRGGAFHGRENTLAAFAHAVEMGYRYVETDVHVTADGVLVAFHDATLDRMTDTAGRISDLPWREVRAARVGIRDGHDERVPTFEELLGTWPDLRVNVDPKSDAAVGPLVEAVRRTNALDRVCVGSFSDHRLRAARRALGPGLCTSLGPRGVTRLRALSLGPSGRAARGAPGTPVPTNGAPTTAAPTAALNGRPAVPLAQVPIRARVAGGYRLPIVDARFVRYAHRRGIEVHVWTVDDAEEMTRLLDLGVDGIMTDRVEVLREVLSARGQWVA
jgi:glycerophosphoryl diester phosphodiesterase